MLCRGKLLCVAKVIAYVYRHPNINPRHCSAPNKKATYETPWQGLEGCRPLSSRKWLFDYASDKARGQRDAAPWLGAQYCKPPGSCQVFSFAHLRAPPLGLILVLLRHFLESSRICLVQFRGLIHRAALVGVQALHLLAVGGLDLFARRIARHT